MTEYWQTYMGWNLDDVSIPLPNHEPSGTLLKRTEAAVRLQVDMRKGDHFPVKVYKPAPRAVTRGRKRAIAQTLAADEADPALKIAQDLAGIHDMMVGIFPRVAHPSIDNFTSIRHLRRDDIAQHTLGRISRQLANFRHEARQGDVVDRAPRRAAVACDTISDMRQPPEASSRLHPNYHWPTTRIVQETLLWYQFDFKSGWCTSIEAAYWRRFISSGDMIVSLSPAIQPVCLNFVTGIGSSRHEMGDLEKNLAVEALG
ncbi:hypothetical protein P7C70_g4367, partial [Phenoliferia sp. Uapishka_3]